MEKYTRNMWPWASIGYFKMLWTLLWINPFNHKEQESIGEQRSITRDGHKRKWNTYWDMKVGQKLVIWNKKFAIRRLWMVSLPINWMWKHTEINIKTSLTFDRSRPNGTDAVFRSVASPSAEKQAQYPSWLLGCIILQTHSSELNRTAYSSANI